MTGEGDWPRWRILLIRHRKTLILSTVLLIGMLSFALLINHLLAGLVDAPIETLLAVGYMLLVVFVVGCLEAD